MGGAGATSEAISKSGVVASMLENLNGLHGPPYKPTGNNDRDSQVLRERLFAYNKTRFFEEFSYPYQRSQTRPERWDRKTEVIGKDGFVSFPVEESNNVRWYVENRILQGSDLPEAEKNNFKADVGDMVQSLIMTDGYGWQADEFVRTYSDLRVEGMIIWDVISAPDPSGNNPTSQRLMVLHYVGAGYYRRK
ncbi:hypothetical protein GMORB2_3585 [Geosmithia morbida]|uniref:Uncharacterized protein n=1 Tax=Geosmithia morbida TaxID=1094350 RepID=A0A9P5CYY9_9HYPO|nr:uncharacterized protein GMORB2_3585 [Geosmithia morbida]KAF4119897.1 hypothetical protein GMORB2_3585 [Geosmithia morbida]